MNRRLLGFLWGCSLACSQKWGYWWWCALPLCNQGLLHRRRLAITDILFVAIMYCTKNLIWISIDLFAILLSKVIQSVVLQAKKYTFVSNICIIPSLVASMIPFTGGRGISHCTRWQGSGELTELSKLHCWRVTCSSPSHL